MIDKEIVLIDMYIDTVCSIAMGLYIIVIYVHTHIKYTLHSNGSLYYCYIRTLIKYTLHSNGSL